VSVKKRMIAVVMILSLLILGACKNSPEPTQPAQPTMVGNWTTQVDMTDTVNQMVAAQTGFNTVAVSFPVVLELSLQQDGTYTLGLDRVQLDAQIDSLGDVLWQIVADQAAAQSHMTVAEAKEALNTQGKSKEALLQQLDFVSMFENSICQTGVWKQEDGMLYMAVTAEELAAAEGTALQFTGDQFTLTYTEIPAEEDQDPVQTVVTYTRVEK